MRPWLVPSWLALGPPTTPHVPFAALNWFAVSSRPPLLTWFLLHALFSVIARVGVLSNRVRIPNSGNNLIDIRHQTSEQDTEADAPGGAMCLLMLLGRA